MGALLFCFFSAYCAQFVTNEIEKPLKIKGFSIWRRMLKSLCGDVVMFLRDFMR